jgi:DEAD/DEAH box helicase domain-containing protein
MGAEALESVFPGRQQALDGFLGAAYALHHVAALDVMCEPGDLGRAVGDGDAEWLATTGPAGRGRMQTFDGGELDPEGQARFTPAVFLYDNYPGGVGLSAPLFERRDEVVRQAGELIAACGCRFGCPACVGPILSGEEERGFSPKAGALRVLELCNPTHY